MKVIPYGRQSIIQEDIDAVVETLKSDFLTQGPKIVEFENKFADYVGAKYAVAVSNATAGLHIAVKSMGIKDGDRVITSPITFAASANCVRFCGGEVWLADINPDTYLLDIDAVTQLIKSKPKGYFKGIIPVDFAGLPVDLEAYRELADKHNLWLIEDAAHAPGGLFIDSKDRKNYCGNGIYADCSVFSFHPVKHIACGEGGMVTTNNEEIYKLLQLYRSHGITKENMTENHGGWYYEMQTLGFNYRMTDVQAALGITQLKRNSEGIIRRNEIAQKYKEAFGDKIKYQSLPKETLNAHHLFVIEVKDRIGLYDHLINNNILAQIHYIPLHLQPYYKNVGFGNANLSNAENYYKRCISLPMYPTLTDEEQDFVIGKVLEYYG